MRALAAGDRALVAFAAPCCHSRFRGGEIVVVVDPNVQLPSDYEFICAYCKRVARSSVAEVAHSTGLGLVSAQRLLRLPPDEEMGAEQRVIRRRAPA